MFVEWIQMHSVGLNYLFSHIFSIQTIEYLQYYMDANQDSNQPTTTIVLAPIARMWVCAELPLLSFLHSCKQSLSWVCKLNLLMNKS